MVGLIFTLFIFVLSWMIYYPFFKVYDKQCVQKEAEDEAQKAKLAARKNARQETNNA